MKHRLEDSALLHPDVAAESRAYYADFVAAVDAHEHNQHVHQSIELATHAHEMPFWHRVWNLRQISAAHKLAIAVNFTAQPLYETEIEIGLQQERGRYLAGRNHSMLRGIDRLYDNALTEATHDNVKIVTEMPPLVTTVVGIPDAERLDSVGRTPRRHHQRH